MVRIMGEGVMVVAFKHKQASMRSEAFCLAVLC